MNRRVLLLVAAVVAVAAFAVTPNAQAFHFGHSAML